MPSEVRLEKDKERKELTRQRLLDAAVEVFSERGYHRALVSDIVKKAGVGQGTFYRHFTDKRVIFEALMEQLMDAVFDEFSDMSENLPSNLEEYVESSKKALVRMARKVEDQRKLILLFLREAPSVNKEIEETVQLIYSRFAGLAKFYLDHAIAKGFARSCRSDVVAQSIVGIGLRIMDQWWSESFENLSIEELVCEAVDFGFSGLVVHPPETVTD